MKKNIALNEDINIKHVESYCQLLTLDSEECKDVLFKTYLDAIDPDNQNITFHDFKDSFFATINSIHIESRYAKGSIMYNINKDNPISAFANDIFNSDMRSEYGIRRILTFDERSEIWVVVDNVNSDVIYNFNNDVYAISSKYDFKISPIIVGENEVDFNEVNFYNNEIKG